MTGDATPAGPALLLLGGVELRGVSADDAGQLLAQSKTVAFLSCLALSPPGRHQRRDRLVALLWPELDQAHARAALRKAVHAARQALGAEALLSRGDEDLVLAPGALWCDAAEFIALTDMGRTADALELYRGELLPGFHLSECGEFDRWLEEQRTGLRHRAAAAAWGLAKDLEIDSQYTEAGVWARRAAGYVWTDERKLRHALQMLDRVGDRAGALRLYEDFVYRLRTELDAQPSPETASLVATLRSG
jgi:DNA-binding SARP family transcriptional activator